MSKKHKITLYLSDVDLELLEEMAESYFDDGPVNAPYRSNEASALVAYITTSIDESKVLEGE